MSDGSNSPHWYRVAKLKPRLQEQVQVHRHDYRGLIWYLLENTATGRSHRFNPAAYEFIGMMDGHLTVADIHAVIEQRLEEFAPGQEEIVDLLGRLHNADLMKCEVRTDVEELFERGEREKSAKRRQRFANPVALRFALWDPEDFLNRHFAKVGWIFSRPVAVAWVLLIVAAAVQAARHWGEIGAHFTLNALSPYNLLLMFLLYPPVKFLHELGHAFSAKLEGGEVHEMGINFLLFMPVPYVNVSTATHFRNPWKRVLVSAAGILVEGAVAAIGLLLFLAAEPGVVRDIGFNLFVIGGVSSLFFNGNPLLKYDGYYILADLVAIPNLFQRASRYWLYLVQRYGFGLRDAVSPVSAPGEAGWFLGYGLASAAYRLAILWFIVTVVTEHFFYPGLLLAGWLIGLQILLPLSKGLRFLVSSPSLERSRGRAYATSSTISVVLVGLVGFMPVPAYTLSEGVVQQPDDAHLRAEHDGFVGELAVANQQWVAAGTRVLSLRDPLLRSQLAIAEARVRELEARHRAGRARSHIEAGIVAEELSVAESELRFIRDKAAELTLTADKTGRLVIPDASDLPGRFVRKGEVLGYILDDQPPTVRMAVRQDHIGQLRERVADVRVRFANRPATEFAAVILRQAPEATPFLPAAALAVDGGGRFVVKPGTDVELASGEKVFLVDLQPDFGDTQVPLGTRAWVRIDHGSESLASQWYRRVRQVFLRQFDV